MVFLTNFSNAWSVSVDKGSLVVDIQLLSGPLSFSVYQIPPLIEPFFLEAIYPSTEEPQYPYWLH